MTMSPTVREAFETFEREVDALVHLAAIRAIESWLRQKEQEVLQTAREQGYGWEHIAEAQGRSLRSAHRRATQTPRRPRMPGLTTPDFNGVSTGELRYWLEWWSSPARTPEGRAEAGRDPITEQAKFVAEITAREAAGLTDHGDDTPR